MKHPSSKAGIVLLALLMAADNPCQALTTFLPRSQGANTARELVGWQTQLYRCYTENYTAIASSIEYTRSFQTECIAQHLFSTNRLTFAGSQALNRTDTEIVADYFGLPTDFRGTLIIKPRIENVIIDLNLYFGLDDWAYGLYVRVHAPITHTRWTLGLDDCVACSPKFRGCTVFPPCYMFSVDEQPTSPANCPTPQITRMPPDNCPVNGTLHPPVVLRNANCTTQSIREALSGNFTFGDMVEPWKFGRFDFCPRSKTGLADIDFIVGMNFFHNDQAHAGIFGLVVTPTGNRPKAKFIFEPIVGNGRHWELGGGFSAHAFLFPDDGTCFRNLGFYFEGNITRVMPTHQIRSFDFKTNGLLSRYILLKEFDTAGEYDARMINAINFATRNCEVHVRLQSDISAKFVLINGGWNFDVGYNFFFRDKECVKIKTDCPCAIDSRIFGIKGLEGVCCENFQVVNDTLVPPATGKTLLGTTQPDATMFVADLPKSEPVPENPTSLCLSWNSPTVPEEGVPLDDLISEGFVIANTSNERHFVTCADLDPQSAAQGRMMTHKLFAHLCYIFQNSYYTPHVGLGFEAEFNQHNKNNALQQWGIWLKGGACF